MRERQEGAAQRADEASCPSSESQKTRGQAEVVVTWVLKTKERSESAELAAPVQNGWRCCLPRAESYTFF